MAKRKTKSRALGDDPMEQIAKDATAEKIEVKETQPKKINKKATIKIQAVKKTKAKKAQTKKGRAKKRLKKHTHENNTSSSKTLQESQIKLDPVLVISNAQTLHVQLGALLDTKQNITIEAFAVEMVDTAILQLLLAFVIKIKAQGRKIIWTKPSEELIRRATILNLQTGLGLDEAEY